MRLAASAIRREINAGNLSFNPPVNHDLIEGGSVDLTLWGTFHVFQPVFEEQRRAGVTSAIGLTEYDWFRFLERFGEETVVEAGDFFEIPLQ